MINIPQQCVRYHKHFGLILCAIINSDYLDKYVPDVLHIGIVLQQINSISTDIHEALIFPLVGECMFKLASKTKITLIEP